MMRKFIVTRGKDPDDFVKWKEAVPEVEAGGDDINYRLTEKVDNYMNSYMSPASMK
jgi:hypothetical protein